MGSFHFYLWICVSVCSVCETTVEDRECLSWSCRWLGSTEIAWPLGIKHFPPTYSHPKLTGKKIKWRSHRESGIWKYILRSPMKRGKSTASGMFFILWACPGTELQTLLTFNPSLWFSFTCLLTYLLSHSYGITVYSRLTWNSFVEQVDLELSTNLYFFLLTAKIRVCIMMPGFYWATL